MKKPWKAIKLTQNKWSLVDAEDYDKLSELRWHARNRHNRYYALRKNGVSMARKIMNPPEKMVIDHINGNTLDNRKVNLRVCTHKQNCRNTKFQVGASKFKGVSWDKDREKWQSGIRVDDKRKALGRFDSEEDAARAYDIAARENFGEFAKLNFA